MKYERKCATDIAELGLIFAVPGNDRIELRQLCPSRSHHRVPWS